ncbi:MAG: hypothetical protein ACKO7C_02610 [Bacteroidota bacterium]
MIKTCFLLIGIAMSTLAFAQRKVGDVVDEFNGVKVYYNGSVYHVGARNVSADGYTIGCTK